VGESEGIGSASAKTHADDLVNVEVVQEVADVFNVAFKGCCKGVGEGWGKAGGREDRGEESEKRGEGWGWGERESVLQT
jgi:hypothetical protein